MTQDDLWREAVIDEAAVLFLSEEGTPREVLKRVIEANAAIALDPAVSEQAQALIDKGNTMRAAVDAFYRAIFAVVCDLAQSDPAADTPQGELLQQLSKAVEDYEKCMYPIGDTA